jgi:hypothetical protein
LTFADRCLLFHNFVDIFKAEAYIIKR